MAECNIFKGVDESQQFLLFGVVPGLADVIFVNDRLLDGGRLPTRVTGQLDMCCNCSYCELRKVL